MSTYLIHSPDGNGSSEGVSLPRGCQAVDGTYRAYGPGFPKLLFVLLQRDPQELIFRHELSHCDILCSFCGDEHWIEERVQGSTLTVPKFSTYCASGAVMMDKFDDRSLGPRPA